MSIIYPRSTVREIPQLDPNACIRLGHLRQTVEFRGYKELLEANVVDRGGGSFVALLISARLFAAVIFPSWNKVLLLEF